MAICHRVGDSRSCGAATVASGNQFVKVDGQLWAVQGDPDSHGAGSLNNSQSFVKINGLYVILVGDSAESDSLCPILGGPHCSPSASSGSDFVTVN